MKLNLNLFLFVVLASAQVYAGNEGGGGGNAVVCFNSKEVADKIKANGENIIDVHLDDITFIEVLDLYEAKKPQGYSGGSPALIEMEADDTVKSYIGKIHNRFSFNVRALTLYIQHGRKTFIDSRIKRTKLFKVNDVNPQGPPSDEDKCVYATIAKQEGGFLYLDPRLHDHKLHSERSKAVLMLHEYIRLQATYAGHADALKTRQLVGTMITKNLGMTVKEIWEQTADMGFKHNPKPNAWAVNASPYYIINELTEHFANRDVKVCAYDQELASVSGMTAEKKGKLVAAYMASDIREYAYGYGDKYYFGIGKVSEIPDANKSSVVRAVECSVPLYVELATKANCKFTQDSKTGKRVPDWRNAEGQSIPTPLSSVIQQGSAKCYHLEPDILTNYEIN